MHIGSKIPMSAMKVKMQDLVDIRADKQKIPKWENVLTTEFNFNIENLFSLAFLVGDEGYILLLC